MAESGEVVLAPIGREDVWEVGAFLHEHLNPRVSCPEWASAIVPTWAVDSPNHGFLLRHDGRIVGVQLAFYSRREVAGAVEDFCNIGLRCFAEPYGSQGLAMLRALLDQSRYTFTDLSRTGNVLSLEPEWEFDSLDTTTVLVPNLPVTWPRATRIISDPEAIGDLLDVEERRIFHDHLRGAAAIHLLMVRGDERCYVLLRRDRRRGLPVFASVLHVSNPTMLRRRLPDLGRHLLLHYGALYTLVELRLIGSRPSLGVVLRSPKPKLYRSTHLSADSIDDLYSELALVAR